MKKAKGITLIALVITIIVLLILAGVSISLTLGNNGILNQAKNGVEKHRDASEEELISLGYSAYQTAKLSGQRVLKPDIGGAIVTENGENGWTVDFDSTGNSYELSLDGTIEKQEPFNPVEWDKTASDEDCFIWASDDPSSEDYGIIVGYTQKAGNNTILKYPSRTTKITFNYDTYQEKFNGVNADTARSYTDNIVKIVVPGTVKKIERGSFTNPFNNFFNNLKEIELSDGLVSIESAAFQSRTSIEKVILPKTLNNIDGQAFSYCNNLKTVILPNGLKEIGGNAFDSCTSLENITLPDSLVNLGGCAFRNCSNLVSLKVGKGITSIKYEQFGNCNNIEELVIPENVIEIATDFKQTKWYQNQPDGIIYINKVLYSYKGNMPENANITIKEGIKIISNYAFGDCTNLSGITIPRTVTTIGDSAFSQCTGLSSITIPSSVINMGEYVFSGHSLTVNAEATEQPSGWSSNWNKWQWYSNPPIIVNWGYTGN